MAPLRPVLAHAGAVASAAVCIASLTGCLSGRFDKPDPAAPGPNASTAQVIERINKERQARNLPASALVPELGTLALRDTVLVARGDQSLATAAHSTALHAVQAMGRHTWAFATDCADLGDLRLPPMATEMRELMMNVAAVAGHGGRTYVLLVISEPGTSSIRADQIGGGAGGTNPSIEAYVHPMVAPGRCGDRWPGAQRSGG